MSQFVELFQGNRSLPTPLPFPNEMKHASPKEPISVLLQEALEILSEDLYAYLPRLLSLNPSRRDAIARYLSFLGKFQAPEGSLSLKDWVEKPLNASYQKALITYFEEIAIFYMAQSLILKRWSDLKIRTLQKADLGKINWVLSTFLKPKVPLQREGWQITRPNLYSWYTPSPETQERIWALLSQCPFCEEDPWILKELFQCKKNHISESRDAKGYSGFFDAWCWKMIESFFEPTQADTFHAPCLRKAFTPTLRTGQMQRLGPAQLRWVGLEATPIYLFQAELFELWKGQCAPQYWSLGSGLEVHGKDQLALTLAPSKPSLHGQISEMEDCDLALVFEEQLVRLSSRSPLTQRYREQIERKPFLKKLKSQGTTLGDLQACISLSKLRPGGILLWTRPEPLSSKDGAEVLRFLLDRAILLGEWNFSFLRHELPTNAQEPLIPEYMYVFQRQPELEFRLTHRPILHSIEGTIRSYVEIESVFQSIYEKTCSEAQAHVSPGDEDQSPSLMILSCQSPHCQRDWLEKWPDPTSQETLKAFEQLKHESLPLANFATIRPAGEDLTSPPTTQHGFWMFGCHENGERTIHIEFLENHSPTTPPREDALLILVPNPLWPAILASYLKSQWVKQWLDVQAERRAERWLLRAQIVKCIPIPRSLIEGLEQAPSSLETITSFSELSAHWQTLIREVQFHPKTVLEALKQLREKDPHFWNIHRLVFLHTALAMKEFQTRFKQIQTLVKEDGKIHWSMLLRQLPEHERIPLAQHPELKLLGHLPAHLTIHQVQKVQNPRPGILLASESGFHLTLACENRFLRQLMEQQIQGLSFPTWQEITQKLIAPRYPKKLEALAFEILKAYEEQKQVSATLTALANTCRWI